MTKFTADLIFLRLGILGIITFLIGILLHSFTISTGGFILMFTLVIYHLVFLSNSAESEVTWKDIFHSRFLFGETVYAPEGLEFTHIEMATNESTAELSDGTKITRPVNRMIFWEDRAKFGGVI